MWGLNLFDAYTDFILFTAYLSGIKCGLCNYNTDVIAYSLLSCAIIGLVASLPSRIYSWILVGKVHRLKQWRSLRKHKNSQTGNYNIEMGRVQSISQSNINSAASSPMGNLGLDMVSTVSSTGGDEGGEDEDPSIIVLKQTIIKYQKIEAIARTIKILFEDVGSIIVIMGIAVTHMNTGIPLIAFAKIILSLFFICFGVLRLIRRQYKNYVEHASLKSKQNSQKSQQSHKSQKFQNKPNKCCTCISYSCMGICGLLSVVFLLGFAVVLVFYFGFKITTKNDDGSTDTIQLESGTTVAWVVDVAIDNTQSSNMTNSTTVNIGLDAYPPTNGTCTKEFGNLKYYVGDNKYIQCSENQDPFNCYPYINGQQQSISGYCGESLSSWYETYIDQQDDADNDEYDEYIRGCTTTVCRNDRDFDNVYICMLLCDLVN